MVKGEVVSPPFLAFPERLVFGILLSAAPLFPPEVAPAHLLPLIPFAAVGLAFGKVSRLQRFTVILAYVLSLGALSSADSFSQVSSLCFFLGLAYLLLAWIDAKLTAYVFLPGEVRVRSIQLEELKLREEAVDLRLEDVVSITKRVPILSSLLKLRFYDVYLRTRGGELRLRGLPERLKLEAWLRRRLEVPRTEKKIQRQAAGEEAKRTARELEALRRALEKGSARRVVVSAGSASASLSAEFLNPKADALDVIEDAYLLAERVLQRFGAGGKPRLRVESAEGGLRTNRIERLL